VIPSRPPSLALPGRAAYARRMDADTAFALALTLMLGVPVLVVTAGTPGRIASALVHG
jgi:hypothetical protein